MQSIKTIIFVLLCLCLQSASASERERDHLKHFATESTCKKNLAKANPSWNAKRITWECRPAGRSLISLSNGGCLSSGKRFGTWSNCKHIDSSTMPQPRDHTPVMPISRMNSNTIAKLLPDRQLVYTAGAGTYRVYRSGTRISVNRKSGNSYKNVCRFTYPQGSCSILVPVYRDVPGFCKRCQYDGLHTTYHSVTPSGLWVGSELHTWR